MIGGVGILMRRYSDDIPTPAWGSTPSIPPASPQPIPTLKMPTARGWDAGRTPVAAPGLKVNAFAAGLKHPRWIHVLPNGDVLTAEALSVPGGISSVFDYAMTATMRRAALALSLIASPLRRLCLRTRESETYTSLGLGK